MGSIWDKMSSKMPSEPLPFPPNESLVLLAQVRQLMTQKQLGERLSVTPKTIGRWERRETDCPNYVQAALREMLPARARSDPDKGAFTLIDLFAGIGGMRKGFESAGGRCVFTSEWNEWSKKTYRANFPNDPHEIVGDIVPYDASDIPDHDVLLAGFPCQPFSIAGVSKKNALGRPHGFECATQGTLFFDVARIIAEKQPKAFLLENVKNLISHDGGNTFRVIKETLSKELGYHIQAKVIDGQCFTPQHREPRTARPPRPDRSGWTTAAESTPAASRSGPPADDRSRTSDSADVPTAPTPPTEPPAPSRPETAPAVSSSRTSQSLPGMPMSAVARALRLHLQT